MLRIGRSRGTFLRGRGNVTALRSLLHASLSGVLIALAVTVAGTWPLAFVALVPLLRALDAEGTTARRALALGWVAGLVTQAVGTHWLVGTLVRFSGHPWPLAFPLALGAWCAEGLRIALFAWIVRLARPHGAWAAPFAWAVLERTLPMLLPWQLAAGLGEVPLLVQTADLGGATLVSTLVVAVNASVAAWPRAPGKTQQSRRGLALPTALACAAALGYGAYRIAAVDAEVAHAPALRVGLVQAAVDPSLARRRPHVARDRLVALSRGLVSRERPGLLVWPESALAGAVDARDGVSALAGELGVPVLLGAITLRTASADAGLYNSALLVAPDGRVHGRHDKRRLVPFGERIPFADAFPALRALAPNAGRFRSGRPAPPIEVDGARITALVCYEDILPGLVRALAREAGPNLLANLTNDAWFGETTEPWTHFALGRLRAVEHRRALVRAANTGVTAVVDPVGRVLAQAPSFTEATLVARVPLLETRTLYTMLGDWPVWLGVLVLLVGARVVYNDRARSRCP